MRLFSISLVLASFALSLSCGFKESSSGTASFPSSQKLSASEPSQIECDWTQEPRVPEDASEKEKAYLNFMTDTINLIKSANSELHCLEVYLYTSEEESIGATAWLGKGGINIYKGSFKHLPNFEAFAFMLAHEVTHNLKHGFRHDPEEYVSSQIRNLKGYEETLQPLRLKRVQLLEEHDRKKKVLKSIYKEIRETSKTDLLIETDVEEEISELAFTLSKHRDDIISAILNLPAMTQKLALDFLLASEIDADIQGARYAYNTGISITGPTEFFMTLIEHDEDIGGADVVQECRTMLASGNTPGKLQVHPTTGEILSNQYADNCWRAFNIKRLWSTFNHSPFATKEERARLTREFHRLQML